MRVSFRKLGGVRHLVVGTPKTGRVYFDSDGLDVEFGSGKKYIIREYEDQAKFGEMRSSWPICVGHRLMCRQGSER